MAVDEDGRRVGARGAQVADDERVAVADLHELRAAAGALDVVGGPLRGAPQVGRVAAAGGDRRDPQPLDELVEEVAHGRDRLFLPTSPAGVGYLRKPCAASCSSSSALGVLAGGAAIAQGQGGQDAYELQEPAVTSAQVLRLPSDACCVRFTRATVRFLPPPGAVFGVLRVTADGARPPA